MTASSGISNQRAASSPAPDPRAKALRASLDGAIAPVMIRLALPTLIVLIVQVLVGVMEQYFVSKLGTDSLAGASLVFPVLMLMQMMANGGIGGGVAAAMARALGAGESKDAEGVLFQALALGLGFGVVFNILTWLAAPILYAAMGGTGESLKAAVTYSNWTFLASVPLWVTALLSAGLRGAGDVKTPAVITFAGAMVMVPLSPALIFGWGFLPQLGIAGAGIAIFIYYLGAAFFLIRYLASGRAPLKLSLLSLDKRLLSSIMGVGTLSALGTIMANLTVACVTGAVGLFGAEAIAGYGIASRLDYLLIPILFGLGTAAVTMVGANVGANQPARARQIAWTGAVIGGGVTGLIGLVAALAPSVWTKLFDASPAVWAVADQYLRTVAPFYVLFGVGMMLFFASQGARRVVVPIIAGAVRLTVAGFIGWFAVRSLGIGMGGLFGIVATSFVLFGLICIGAVLSPSWGTVAGKSA